MDNQLQTFEFQSHELTALIDEHGAFWFVAKDVCEILEHSNVSVAVSRLDDDEKLTSTLFISGQNREVLLINESGLYSLIMTSRKPEAKAFKKWVTSEVLPAIRKTGSYIAPHSPAQAYLDELKSHTDTQRLLIASQIDQIDFIKDNCAKDVAKAEAEAQKAFWDAKSATDTAKYTIEALERQINSLHGQLEQVERSKYPVGTEEAIAILAKLFIRKLPVREVAEAHYRSVEAIRKVRKYPPMMELPMPLVEAINAARQQGAGV